MDQFIFDIETMPLGLAALEAEMPEFSAPGNLRNPLKIEDSIAEKRANYIEKAALSPLTGRVCMIGTMTQSKTERDAPLIDMLAPVLPEGWDDEAKLDEMEAHIIAAFWDQCRNARDTGMLIVGFNSHGFDLPFLVKRSMRLKVKTHLPPFNGRYPFSAPFTDLMEKWQMGRKEEYTSLDTVARFLGLGAKNGKGSEVAGLLKSQTAQAIDYLKNDLLLTGEVARRVLY